MADLANSAGLGMPRVAVSLTDPAGMAQTALTNQFGYFSFENVAAGRIYVISASAKRYIFGPSVLQVGDGLTNLEITPEPPGSAAARIKPNVQKRLSKQP